MKYLNNRLTTPLIPDELWAAAKHRTLTFYDGSLALGYVRRCMEQFEQICGKAKYMSDFREFVFESAIEDFCEISKSDVVVSTIHKAKGKEFDDVFMLLSNQPHKDSKLFRQYYVGMTRAKNRLFIHTNSSMFDRFRTDRYEVDSQHFQMPEEVVLQLNHKDLFLDFFKYRKKEVLALRSGDSLTYKDHILYVPRTGKPVAKLSAAMQKVMSEWMERGYQVNSASVRFVVAWKPKNAPKEAEEIAVLLPDIVMVRNGDDGQG